MRCWFIAIFVFLAIPPAAFAGKAETLPALKERAESAPLEMRPGLYTEIARREAEDADQLYTAGKAEEAEAAVEEAVKYSDKAREAAIRSSKKLKQTEIGMRKLAVRLRDIKRTLNFEDQPPVQAAVDHLEQMRTELLSQMFGKKKAK
jgi:soluble cytochrome b562